jgi:ribosomal RNA-processing protein 36
MSSSFSQEDIPLAERLSQKKNGFVKFDPRSMNESDLSEPEVNAPKKKRANKNCPLEITSKKAVSRFRQAVKVKKKKSIDPRFDSMCGKLNQDLFEKSYSFLDEYKVIFRNHCLSSIFNGNLR